MAPPHTSTPTATTGRRDWIALARDNWADAGWDDAADGMVLVTSIMRLQQVFLAEVEAVLRPDGLTFARFEVLRLLAFSSRGSLPAGLIGDRLQVHPASVTNAVQRLEDDALVERSANPRDGRSVLATITLRGRTLVGHCTARLNTEVFERMPIDVDELSNLVAALGDLRHRLDDIDTPE